MVERQVSGQYFQDTGFLRRVEKYAQWRPKALQRHKDYARESAFIENSEGSEFVIRVIPLADLYASSVHRIFKLAGLPGSCDTKKHGADDDNDGRKPVARPKVGEY